MVRGVVVAALATLVLAGSPSAVAQPPAPPVPIIPLPVQPANVGDLKRDAVAYYDSGAYLTNLQQAAAPAVAWINEQAPRVAHGDSPRRRTADRPKEPVLSPIARDRHADGANLNGFTGCDAAPRWTTPAG